MTDGGTDDPDDYEYAWEEASSPVQPVPQPVRTAGAIWLGVGLVGLLITLVLVFVHWLAAAISNGLSLLLINAGLQALNSDAADTLRPGVGSVGAGVLVCGLSALGMLDAIRQPKAEELAVLLATAVIGALLVVAGSLAIDGRQQYLAWKELHDAAADDVESEPPPE